MLVGVVDVPAMAGLGVLSAVLYRRTLRERSVNWYAVLTASFVTIAWLNVAGANILSTAFWLVGTPVTSLHPTVGVPFVISYPLWFRAAGEATFVLIGRRPDQGGLLWVFRLSDRTAPIETPWEPNARGGGADPSRDDGLRPSERADRADKR